MAKLARAGTALALMHGWLKAMLRISETNTANKGAILRLDGSLTGPWVHELRLACEPILAQGEGLQIDCGGVSFVDTAGISLLQALRSKGTSLVNCSPFIKLQLERNGSKSRKP
ncbi:MAG TPA: STAS domain-containing protein [Candidatus Angelobacter sp.]